MESVQKLQDTLTAEQIGRILDCNHPLAANQTLLDYLIKNVENKESILDFCDHLEKIKNSHKLQSLVEHLRKGKDDNWLAMYVRYIYVILLEMI